eukprot:4192731-Pyramimonas_sp.AAC.1
MLSKHKSWDQGVQRATSVSRTDPAECVQLLPSGVKRGQERPQYLFLPSFRPSTPKQHDVRLAVQPPPEPQSPPKPRIAKQQLEWHEPQPEDHIAKLMQGLPATAGAEVIAFFMNDVHFTS